MSIGAWGGYLGMRRLDGDFQVFSTFRRKVAFACFENFDVASFHLLTAQLYGAERQHNPISAGWRTLRARRTVPKNSNEIIFQQGTWPKGLKKEQRCKDRPHCGSLHHYSREFPGIFLGISAIDLPMNSR
jgi:hypothetical protein